MTTIWHEIDGRHHYHKCSGRTSHLRASVCPDEGRMMIVLHFRGEVHTQMARQLTEEIVNHMDKEGLVNIRGHKILINDKKED